MSLAMQARHYFAYNAWADDRILETASAADPEQLAHKPDFNLASIIETLQHALGTQRTWLSRWTGSAAKPYEFAALRELREAYAESHADLRRWAATLVDDDWHRREAWWKAEGYDEVVSLGDTITQVYYHGIQHRAEVALMLTALGHSPGELDHFDFLESLASSRA
jgi:uncharacterized damage-inducible protein DinB